MTQKIGRAAHTSFALWLGLSSVVSCASHPVNSDESSDDAGLAADVGAPQPTGPYPLVDHSAWRRFDAARDPFADHQPPQIECGIAGWLIERGLLEVDTGRCNYLLVEHPSLHAVSGGTDVSFQFFHYDLASPEPSEAHIALLFGDAVQWETTLAIPRSADVITARFAATHALVAGEPIRVHLHNHGQNTWTFVSIEAEAP